MPTSNISQITQQFHLVSMNIPFRGYLRILDPGITFLTCTKGTRVNFFYHLSFYGNTNNVQGSVTDPENSYAQKSLMHLTGNAFPRLEE